MKKLILLILIIPTMVSAQVDIIPSVANHIFTMGYGEGGNAEYVVGGSGVGSFGGALNIEWKLRQPWKLEGSMTEVRKNLTFFSVLFAAHYTNHDQVVTGRTDNDDDLYSNLGARFIHVPVIFRYNFQPFVLSDDFKIGMGLGVVNSFLLKYELEEEAVVRTFDTNGNLLTEVTIADQGDVTEFGNPYTPMMGVDFSISFGRLYVAQRAWFTFGDQFMSDLPANWGVPSQYSIYIDSHSTFRKLTYSGGGFIVGWKIN